MFGLSFKRNTGAIADQAELEYVIALHQTCMPETRDNATVSTTDIQRFLLSRYSVKITHEEALNVVRGLGGGRAGAGGGLPMEEQQEASRRRRWDPSAGIRMTNVNVSMQNDELTIRPIDESEKFTKNELIADNEEIEEEESENGDEIKKPRASFNEESENGDEIKKPRASFNDTRSSLNGSENGEQRESWAMRMAKGLPVDANGHIQVDLDTFSEVFGVERDEANDIIKREEAKRREVHFCIDDSAAAAAADDDDDGDGDEAGQTIQAPNGRVNENDRNGTDVAVETVTEDTCSAEEQKQPNESMDLDIMNDAEGTSETRSEPLQDNLEINHTRSASSREQQPQNEEQHHDEYLDLIQILSTILIPTIARAADEDRNGLKPPVTPQQQFENPGFWTRNVAQRLISFFVDWQNEHYDAQRPRPKGKLFFDQALSVLLEDMPHAEPVMSEELVEQLLLAHGEVEQAQNAQLIQEMVEAAQSSSGRLDREAIVNAMSSDLTEWDVGSEDRLSSFSLDVFNDVDPTKITSLYEERPAKPGSEVAQRDEETACDAAVADANEERPPVAREKSLRDYCLSCLRHFFFCSSWGGNHGPANPELTNIDMVIDVHASLWTVILIWVFYMLTALLYGQKIFDVSHIEENCRGSELWCMIGNTIATWVLVAVTFAVFGMIMILPLSAGNNPIRRNLVRTLSAAALAVVYSVLPFKILDYDDGRRIIPVDTELTYFLDRGTFEFVRMLTLIAGILLSVSYFALIMKALVLEEIRWIYESPLFSWYTATSYIRGESLLKWAATRKLNALLMNANDLHEREATTQLPGRSLDRRTKKALRKSRNAHSLTMRNYVVHGLQHETAGGMVWTWRRIINGSLFADEGIWIHSRLLVFQTGMVVVGLTLALFLFWSVGEMAKRADDYRAKLDPRLPEYLTEVYPTGAMIRTSLFPAACIATIVIGLLISVYIPSMVSTVLKYRCQVYPSLGSPSFIKYRAAAQNVYMCTANAVYGLIGSAGLFFVVLGAIVFLFQWPPTKHAALRALAWCVGLGSTALLKMAMTTICRKVQYRAFYRIRPAEARTTSLALECWYIGLAGSILIGRVMQFIFASFFWVGRIDEPFLAENVRLLGYSFDYVPRFFVQDLLIHEAHKHPYLQRLGQMYLMKLRHRERFVSNAGAAWRQLFVLAFLPWLARYRVFDDERQAEALDDFDEQKKMEEQEALNQEGIVEKAGKGAVATVGAIAATGDVVGNEVLEAGKRAMEGRLFEI